MSESTTPATDVAALARELDTMKSLLATERRKRKRAERQAELFSRSITKLHERLETRAASAADAQNRRLAKRLRTLIAHVEPPAAGMER